MKKPTKIKEECICCDDKTESCDPCDCDKLELEK